MPQFPLRRRFGGLLLALCAAGPLQAQPASAPGSAPAPARLELVVLGSGGPGAVGRAGSTQLLLLDGKPRILVDAGPGSFARLGEARLSLAAVDIVLLTHLHVDHAGELPGLFKARAVSTRGPITFNVFGPVGSQGQGGDASFPATTQFIDQLFGARGAFGYLSGFAAPISFKVKDVAPGTAGAPVVQTLHSDGELLVRAIAGHHRDAPAVIYRVDYAGRSIAFSGDIDPDGHAALRRIAAGSDLLVFNSVVLDPPGSPEVLYTLHTAPKQIGEIAADAGVKRLLLSHLGPAVDAARDAVRASIAARYAGPVAFAEDGQRLPLP